MSDKRKLKLLFKKCNIREQQINASIKSINKVFHKHSNKYNIDALQSFVRIELIKRIESLDINKVDAFIFNLFDYLIKYDVIGTSNDAIIIKNDINIILDFICAA